MLPKAPARLRLTVDEEVPVHNLHPVSFHRNDPLDVVNAGIQWKVEDSDVPTGRRLTLPNSIRRKRPSGTVMKLSNEDMVTMQQCRLHGTGRDFERLVEDGSNRQCRTQQHQQL